MRRGIWILAACGIVGLALSAGIAGNPFFEKHPPGTDAQMPSTPPSHYFSKSGASDARLKADEKGESPEPSEPASRGTAGRPPSSELPSRPNPAWWQSDVQHGAPDTSPNQTNADAPTSDAGVTPAGYQVKANEAEKSAEEASKDTARPENDGRQSDSATVIHAEYKRSSNESGRGKIRPILQLENNTSPFTEVDASGETDGPPLLPPTASRKNGAGNEDFISVLDTVKRGRETPVGKGEKAGKIGDSSRRSQVRANEPAGHGGDASSGRRTQTPPIVLEWVRKSDINVGQESRCDLVVRNAGRTPAQDVSVTAYFPSSVRLVDASPQPDQASDHLQWRFDSLPPGAETTLQITLIPSQQGQLQAEAFVQFTGSAIGRFQVEQPKLQITVNGPEKGVVGDPASHVITVSNQGTGTANNVIVKAQIPEGLEHPRGRQLAMEIGSLSPGESRKLRLGLVSVRSGVHELQVGATADGTLRQSTTARVRVIAPRLAITVDGPGLRYKGRSASYRLSVTNDGQAPTNNVRVMHKIPEGFEFVRADHGGSYDPAANMVEWFVGRLEPGESAQRNVHLETVKLGEFVHEVTADSEHGVKTNASTRTRIDGTASLALEIVETDDPAEVGTPTSYEIRVRNEGTKAARHVALTCKLPQNMELLGAKGPTEHAMKNGMIRFGTLGQLDPGKTALYRLRVRSTSAGNMRVRAQLVSDSIKQPLTFDELTKFYND